MSTSFVIMPTDNLLTAFIAPWFCIDTIIGYIFNCRPFSTTKTAFLFLFWLRRNFNIIAII